MRWRQVILLYAVAVALGGWYLAIERQPEAPKTEDRPRFLNLDARGLREVRVRRADQVMVSRWDAGGWDMMVR